MTLLIALISFHVSCMHWFICVLINKLIYVLDLGKTDVNFKILLRCSWSSDAALVLTAQLSVASLSSSFGLLFSRLGPVASLSQVTSSKHLKFSELVILWGGNVRLLPFPRLRLRLSKSCWPIKLSREIGSFDSFHGKRTIPPVPFWWFIIFSSSSYFIVSQSD